MATLLPRIAMVTGNKQRYNRLLIRFLDCKSCLFLHKFPTLKMSSKIDITKLDLYGLFEVSPDASIQEIKTAYRKKALKVHPDKCPDNPEAAKLFHQLSEALKVSFLKSSKIFL